MNQLYVGIDVGSKNNVAYLMLPNGDKHSQFPTENNLGGYRMIAKKVVAALESLELNAVQ